MGKEVDRFLTEPSGRRSSRREQTTKGPETELDRFLAIVKSLNKEHRNNEQDKPAEIPRRGVFLANRGPAALTVSAGLEPFKLGSGKGIIVEADKDFQPQGGPVFPKGWPVFPTYVARFLHVTIHNESGEDGELTIDATGVDPRAQDGLTVLVAAATADGWGFHQVVTPETLVIRASVQFVVVGIGFSITSQIALNPLAHATHG